MRPNPFLSTRSLCGGHEEDHLTEFWAAALDSCPTFREGYARFLLAAHAARRGWGAVHIESVAMWGDLFSRCISFMALIPRGVHALPSPSKFALMLTAIAPIAV